MQEVAMFGFRKVYIYIERERGRGREINYRVFVMFE